MGPRLLSGRAVGLQDWQHEGELSGDDMRPFLAVPSHSLSIF